MARLDALAVGCPQCAAKPFEPCVRASAGPRATSHGDRLARARARQRERDEARASLMADRWGRAVTNGWISLTVLKLPETQRPACGALDCRKTATDVDPSGVRWCWYHRTRSSLHEYPHPKGGTRS